MRRTIYSVGIFNNWFRSWRIGGDGNHCAENIESTIGIPETGVQGSESRRRDMCISEKLDFFCALHSADPKLLKLLATWDPARRQTADKHALGESV